MNFSYQNYVDRMKYQPFQWPPDIALAQLHSRCSAPGPPNPIGAKCPCCGYPVKQKMTGWYQRNIYEDFKESGAGIPAYFGLLRFYNVVVILILLVNGIYPLYATNYTCNNYNSNQNLICVIIGPFKYLAYKIMNNTLEQNGDDNMATVLQALQTIVFYILLISNNLSIFYLVYIERYCKKNKKSQQKYLSLLIENLPSDITQQKLADLLTFDSQKPKIKSVTFIKELKKFHYTFRNRVKAYFQIKALHIDNINPKTQTELNNKLIQINKQYNSYKGIDNLPCSKAIVVFETREELNIIHKKLKMSESRSWYIGLVNLFKNQNQRIHKLQTFTSKMPQLQQTLWVNLGQSHVEQMIAKIKTLITFFVLLALCYCLFYFPLKITLMSHSKQTINAALTIWEKVIPNIIGILMLVISLSFKNYMEVLSERRNPKTYLQRSNFVLLTTIMFHLLFYIMIPTIFFVFDNGIYPSVKLYTISEQARTFLVVQLILAGIDISYRIWSTRKVLSLSDQRQAFKFPQKFLHDRVQYKEFPLESKLVIMFKLWSFVLFYSFFLPYITFLISIAMIILYFLEKKNLYVHNTQRRYLGIDLQIKFLNIYINFFCIYQCVIYCLNVDSNWQIYAAVFSTLFSLAVQMIYWRILQKKNNEKRQKKLELIRKKKSGQFTEASRIQQSLLKEFDQVQTEDETTYDAAYKEFISQYNYPEVDEQIQKYVSYIQSDNKQKVIKQTYIELTA